MTRLQRLASLAAAVAMTMPLSLFAESRARQRTDLERLAADLARVLGSGHVEVSGGRPSRDDAEARPRQELQDDGAEASIVAAMNRERAAYGLAPLRINRQLSLAAGDRVNDMLAKHYFDHVSPEGVDPFVWARRHGYDYRTIGENLAVGFRGTSVVDGWMHSPGHRANVLGRAFREVGLAIAPRSPTRGYPGPLVVALYGAR